MFTNKIKQARGFTLIELVVVMAIFLFIIGAAIGIFLSIIQNQKKVLAEQQILNQISYVQEYMSKALRMAETDISGSCTGGGGIYLLTHYNRELGAYQGIEFKNQSDNDTCQEFFLDGVLKEKKDTGSAVAITSTKLNIKSVRFVLNGSNLITSVEKCSGSDECVQPKVTILLNVLIPGDGQSAGVACRDDGPCLVKNQACDISIHKCVPTRTIQTTVSRRNLNVQ